MIERVAGQLLGIDGLYAAVKHGVGAAAIHLRLIELHAFLILGLRSVWYPASTTIRAGAGETVAGGNLRRSQDAIVGDIVECAYRPWRPARDQRHQARERIGRPACRRPPLVAALSA